MRSAFVTVASALLLVSSGCGAGFGSGPVEGEVSLSVTRDYGKDPVTGPARYEVRSSDTVMRVLDRSAEVQTSYGGRFVEAIEGIETTSAPRSRDWFYFVNGIAAEIGAAEYELEDGDAVWWDYRDWTAAMHIPAVTGSYPAPLASAGDRPVRVEVGTLGEIAADTSLAFGPGSSPAESGVFARYALDRGDGAILEVLDETGATTGRFGSGAGLVAALRDSDGSTVWLVTGTDEAGVEAAAGLLDPGVLASTYAVVAPPEGRPAMPVPVGQAEGRGGA